MTFGLLPVTRRPRTLVDLADLVSYAELRRSPACGPCRLVWEQLDPGEAAATAPLVRGLLALSP